LDSEIFTRDDLIGEYEGCLAEMQGKLIRKDYQVEYALNKFMEKDAFQLPNTPRMVAGKDPNFEIKAEKLDGEVIDTSQDANLR
jgi:hypothetical protein